jgi:hypothetical protein
MSEPTPEVSEPIDPAPVVALLEARRTELLGGEDSIGLREQRVEEMQARLIDEQAALAACQAELAALDAAIALIAPPAAEQPDSTEPTEQEV